MSNVTFKVAINNAEFPLLYGLADQPILDPGADVAPRANPAFSGGLASVDWNLLQVQYVQNMLPTATGYQSVDMVEDSSLFPVGTDSFLPSYSCYFPSSSGTGFSYSIGRNTTLGSVYEIRQVAPVPGISVTLAADANTDAVSDGIANGRQFIGVSRTSGFAVYEVQVAGTLTLVALTLPGGLLASNISGLLGVGNYLVLFTNDTLYWSAPTDPLDFSSTNLGAGAQIPTDLVDDIIVCKPIASGFIIYTSKNAVAAQFTNNASTPFRFFGVPGAAGTLSRRTVAGAPGAKSHFSYHSVGLQRVTMSAAETFAGGLASYITRNKCTEFLVGTALPTERPSTNSVSLRDLRNDTFLEFISQRYLVIACALEVANITIGQKQTRDILVYDTVFERWGRLRTKSWVGAIVEFDAKSSMVTSAHALANCIVLPSHVGPAPAAINGDKGLPVRIYWNKPKSVVPDWPPSCLVVGKVKLKRDRHVTINSIEVTGRHSPSDGNIFDPEALTVPTCTFLLSETGATRDSAVQATLVESTADYWRFDSRVTGKNIDILLSGRWEITSVVITGQFHGIR